ncbi:MAG: hypothetical protein U0936_25265 [Planctomycetaceae bacterium]
MHLPRKVQLFSIRLIEHLSAGATDMPASPDPVARLCCIEESIPKLMIKTEEESVGKSLNLRGGSAGTLDDVRTGMGDLSSPQQQR